jgi:branched-chain amino acid transport system substrate-binding protein
MTYRSVKTIVTSALIALFAIASVASAQTVKIGVVNTYTGPAASFGEMTDRAMNLYLKVHQ